MYYNCHPLFVAGLTSGMGEGGGVLTSHRGCACTIRIFTYVQISLICSVCARVVGGWGGKRGWIGKCPKYRCRREVD